MEYPRPSSAAHASVSPLNPSCCRAMVMRQVEQWACRSARLSAFSFSSQLSALGSRLANTQQWRMTRVRGPVSRTLRDRDRSPDRAYLAEHPAVTHIVEFARQRSLPIGSLGKLLPIPSR